MEHLKRRQQATAARSDSSTGRLSAERFRHVHEERLRKDVEDVAGRVQIAAVGALVASVAAEMVVHRRRRTVDDEVRFHVVEVLDAVGARIRKPQFVVDDSVRDDDERFRLRRRQPPNDVGCLRVEQRKEAALFSHPVSVAAVRTASRARRSENVSTKSTSTYIEHATGFRRRCRMWNDRGTTKTSRSS